MGLFTKSDPSPAAPPPAKKARDAKTASADGRESLVLARPWFSEKALVATERGVYAFDVPADATKRDVARAVEALYKVAPRKVAIVNLPAKRVNLRTRRGTGVRGRRRKAYVYLKKGDTIQFA